MTQKQLSIVQGHECMSAWQRTVCKLGYSAGGAKHNSGRGLGVINGRFAAQKHWALEKQRRNRVLLALAVEYIGAKPT